MQKFLSLATITLLSSAGLFLATQIITNHLLGTPNIANGKEKYLTYCIVCHGQSGQGDGIASAALIVKPDSLVDELNNPFGLKLELINSVLEGDNGQGGSMPAFKGTLSKEDVRDIFSYIQSINKS